MADRPARLFIDDTDRAHALAEARQHDLDLANRLEREIHKAPLPPRRYEIWNQEEGECDEPAPGEGE
jgi:hypothetical protein